MPKLGCPGGLYCYGERPAYLVKCSPAYRRIGVKENPRKNFPSHPPASDMKVRRHGGGCVDVVVGVVLDVVVVWCC